jgi:hypothetical protein
MRTEGFYTLDISPQTSAQYFFFIEDVMFAVKATQLTISISKLGNIHISSKPFSISPQFGYTQNTALSYKSLIPGFCL